MKLKYKTRKDTFSITGLTDEHLELLATLISNVRLGENQEAFEFAELFQNNDVSGMLQFRVFDDKTSKYVKEPIIEV